MAKTVKPPFKGPQGKGGGSMGPKKPMAPPKGNTAQSANSNPIMPLTSGIGMARGGLVKKGKAF